MIYVNTALHYIRLIPKQITKFKLQNLTKLGMKYMNYWVITVNKFNQ